MRAAAEYRRTTLLASLSDTVQILRALLAAGDPGRAGAYVDAGLQQPGELIDIGPQRVVATGVRLERDQLLNVVGGLYTGGLGPTGKLAGIYPDLAGAMGVNA